jgi:hypothetical protein
MSSEPATSSDEPRDVDVYQALRTYLRATPPCSACGSTVTIVQKDGPSSGGFPAGPKPTRLCDNIDCVTNNNNRAWAPAP